MCLHITSLTQADPLLAVPIVLDLALALALGPLPHPHRNFLHQPLPPQAFAPLRFKPAPHPLSPLLSSSLPPTLSTPEAYTRVPECLAAPLPLRARIDGFVTLCRWTEMQIWVRRCRWAGTGCHTENDDAHLIDTNVSVRRGMIVGALVGMAAPDDES
jgi:hypothetical protein